MFGFTKDNFVWLDTQKTNHRFNPKVIIITGLVLVIICNLILGLIHSKSYEKFINQPEIQQSSGFSKVVNLDTQVEGEIVYCGYSLTANTCLIQKNGETLWLRDRYGNSINTKPGKTIVTGKLHEKVTGLDEFEVYYIQSID